MLSYILNGLYLVIWSVLLIHCLHHRWFYPIIGRGLLTKAFWLLTFIFFNPFLTLLYVVFAVLLRPRKIEEDSKPIYAGSVVAIVCVIMVIVIFELPLGGAETEPVVISRSSEKDNSPSRGKMFSGFKPVLGGIKATNKVQTYSSAPTLLDARVSISNIMLICNNPHRLIDQVAREFQKSLARLPYVETVEYYPYGTRPESGGLLPDVFITIDMPQVDENKLLYSRDLQARIEWQASSSMFGDLSRWFEDDSSPLVRFSIESELDHVSIMVGIENPRAEYKLEAKNISGELTQSIKKQFENLLDKYGRMPQLPEMLYGPYKESPEFSFINSNKVRWQISGSGLLTDSDTVWQFTDERRTEEALKAYGDELTGLGWMGNDDNKEYLKMQNDNGRIYIYRQRKRDVKPGMIVSSDVEKSTSEAPMIAHYQSRWTEQRVREVMDRVLDNNDVDIKTLLVFDKYFQTPKQRERLCSLIEQSPHPTLDGYLVLANFLADHNEPRKSREMLMLARAMQYAEKGNNVKAQEIENLAEKLGDESLIEAEISNEIFCKTGFINIEEVDGQITLERSLDEPLLFYKRLAEGELHTLTLRVIRSPEPSPVRSYRLLTVEKRKGSSSSVEEDGRTASDGGWEAEFYLHSFADEKKSIRLKIESLVGERFCFLITTELI